jgi:hypothetical protein
MMASIILSPAACRGEVSRHKNSVKNGFKLSGFSMMIELDILAISSRMIPIKRAMIQNGMGNNENPGR